MTDHILEVDLLAFERGGPGTRRTVVDGVLRSLACGFVYTSHDIPAEVLDTAYGGLATFFRLAPEVKQRFVVAGSNGQSGYTGLLVETAAASDRPDWKEMLNWSEPLPAGHPVRRRFPTWYPDRVLPEEVVPGITDVLGRFHRALADLQLRFLRIVAVGLGCHERYFDDLLIHGTNLSRAIRYPPMAEAPGGAPHVWAAAHADIDLITALPRATAAGLQVLTVDGWVDAVPPPGSAIINTGIMLERLTNGAIPAGRHQVVAAPGQPGERYSVVQFCQPAPFALLAPLPTCVDGDRPVRYAPMAAGDLLERVLWEINLVEEGRRIPEPS